MASCWRVVVEGNYPPSEGGVVHNDQSISVPEKVIVVSEGKCGCPSVKGRQVKDLMCPYAVVDRIGGKDADKQGGWEDGDLRVVVRAWV